MGVRLSKKRGPTQAHSAYHTVCSPREPEPSMWTFQTRNCESIESFVIYLVSGIVTAPENALTVMLNLIKLQLDCFAKF